MLVRKSSYTEGYSFLLGVMAFILIILGLFVWQTQFNLTKVDRSTQDHIPGKLEPVSANDSDNEITETVLISNKTGFSKNVVTVPRNTRLVLQFKRSVNEPQGIFFPAFDDKSFQFGVGEIEHVVALEPFQKVGEYDFLASVFTGNLTVFKTMKGVIQVTE